MLGISMTLNGKNHLAFLNRIVKEFSDRKFNVLVQTYRVGELEPHVTKFCGRQIAGEAKVNGVQMSISLSPGGSIAWDLKVESVVVFFDKVSGDIWIQRFFENRQRYKLVKLTINPI